MSSTGYVLKDDTGAISINYVISLNGFSGGSGNFTCDDTGTLTATNIILTSGFNVNGGVASCDDSGQMIVQGLEIVNSLTVDNALEVDGSFTAGSGTFGSGFGLYGASPISQQPSGANLTNNVTVGGIDNIIADFTNLTVYATDAATIRDDIYQLARKVKQINDALRLLGFLS